MNGRSKVNGKITPPTTRRGSAPAASPRRPGRRRKRANPLRKLIGFGALAAVIGGGIWAGKIFSKIAPGIGLGGVVTLIDHPEKFFPNKDQITVLLIGKDYEYDKNYQRYTGKSSRADSIMLLTLDLKKKHVSALSIPRDTRIRVAGKTGKINATIREDTYPGIAGPGLLCDAVEEITGVRPDFYIAIKPDAVGNLVEELRGVEVETIDAFEYHDNKAGLHVKLPKGTVQIASANDAVGYCRYREVDIYQRNPDGSPIATGRTTFRLKPRSEIAELNRCLENGDTRRMARQQNMIRAMIASGKRQLFRVDKIIDTTLKQFDTDLKRDQLLAIASLYRATQPDQVASATLAGEFEKKKPFFFIPDRRKTEALVQWLVYGDEQAANRVTTVAVQNATAISGAARRAAELLRDQGNFDADYVKEASKQTETKTMIWFTKATNKPRAERVSKLLGGGTIQKDMSPDMTGALKEAKPDINVVLGSDLAAHLGDQSALR
ncbi:LCP family protein [Armatimonas sp.]|uniref:LCP family protein n=1 Tax=Armatimonas sp. TaxID=1872638 RepID=UPI003751368A